MQLSAVFMIITCLFAMLDMQIAYLSFRQKTYSGKYLALSCLAAAWVGMTYLISILPLPLFWVSVASSLYFIGVDITLINLIPFVFSFTLTHAPEPKRLKKLKRVLSLVRGLVAVDVCMFLINPFYEVMVGYVYRGGMNLALYGYQMHPMYYVHLALSYFLVLCVLVQFIYKMFQAPLEYRNQFLFSVISILGIIGVNAVFLFLPDYGLISRLDYSIWGYSIIAIILYWSCFIYPKNGMLLRIKNTLFEKTDSGIVIFDYRNCLVLKNKKAEELLTGVCMDSSVRLEDFLKQCGVSVAEDKKYKSFSSQCYFVDQNKDERAVRCDYKILYNRKNQKVGTMLVFIDMMYETDILTEFHNWTSFQRMVRTNPDSFQRSAVVAVCDINSLSLLNTTLGRNAGDQAIQSLAKALRKCFPSDSYFVRGHEANLIVFSYSRSEQEVRQSLESLKEEHNIQYAVTRFDEGKSDLMETVKAALDGMRSRKLMDKSSVHSTLLTSLIKTLRECDADTEAHVRRTQKLGERLGKRIGLSDAQQSDLALLCVMHDIGKIGVPLDVLNKPGRLSETEKAIIRSHAEKGYQIAMSSPELSRIADVVRYHHERWDGKGYPDGLSKESIPLLSRVISVMDAYDAMLSDRPYKKKMTREEAIEEIRRCAGTQFDPYIASEFIRMLREEEADSPEEKSAAAAKKAVQEKEQIDPVSSGAAGSDVIPINCSRYFLDSSMRIIQIDRKFEEITGYTENDIRERKIYQSDLLPEEDRTEYSFTVNRFLNVGNSVYLEHRLKRKDGLIIFVFCFGRQYYDSSVREMRSEILVADVAETMTVKHLAASAHRRAENQLRRWEELYRKDSLTGIWNHAAFQCEVEELMIHQGKRVMFLMMDLDHFKQYNDSFGHQAGDKLLIMVAQTLEAALNNGDMPCRMGGDEFAAVIILKDGETDEQAYERAQQIFDRIRRVLNMEKGNIGVSVGAAMSDGQLNSFNKLYQAADEALYRAKTKGRDRISL